MAPCAKCGTRLCPPLIGGPHGLPTRQAHSIGLIGPKCQFISAYAHVRRARSAQCPLSAQRTVPDAAATAPQSGFSLPISRLPERAARPWRQILGGGERRDRQSARPRFQRQHRSPRAARAARTGRGLQRPRRAAAPRAVRSVSARAAAQYGAADHVRRARLEQRRRPHRVRQPRRAAAAARRAPARGSGDARAARRAAERAAHGDRGGQRHALHPRRRTRERGVPLLPAGVPAERAAASAAAARVPDARARRAGDRGLEDGHPGHRTSSTTRSPPSASAPRIWPRSSTAMRVSPSSPGPGRRRSPGSRSSRRSPPRSAFASRGCCRHTKPPPMPASSSR